MARGVLQSLGSSPGACGDIAAALSTLTRAATLLEPVGRTALVMDSPAALAALVALHSGELAIAGSVLRRAIDTELGGSPARPRHLLLLAWVEMLRGRGAPARELIDAARAAARDGLEPRDELFHRALEVGLARRASDVPALVAAWVRAREAVLRHPVDLFALLPLGELIVAAARLEDTDRLAPHVAAAQALLTQLGEPPLWAAALHWSGVQAAILADDPEALRPHAAALVEASRTSPYAATLARAGRGWLRVLTGDVDPASVVSAAEELAAVGLAWDGSRLAGQAAVRVSDPRARTELLGCARALAEAHGLDQGGGERSSPAAERSPAAPAGGFLSEREREVARLVLAGRTYREIGAQLYISAKTVEHHMSRIRQRLGAGNRSDLLDRLRAELAAGA
jgi:DNA-binding CsgD family transcriptional regulator